MAKLEVVNHPLILDKLTQMRAQSTPCPHFRTLLREITWLLGYEATKHFDVERVDLTTPIQETEGYRLAGPEPCFVSVMRAGNTMVAGLLDIVPSAVVGHVGLERDPKTLESREYYLKLPTDLPERHTIVADPMLATGNSAIAAIERVASRAPKSLLLLTLLAAPEGVHALQERFPELPIITGALDERLNDKGYIVPGLGDAGDRIYGTVH